MFSYSTSMKFDLHSLKAAPSKHPPSQHQISHALMSCLFNSNPDQVALGGLHPGVSLVNL